MLQQLLGLCRRARLWLLRRIRPRFGFGGRLVSQLDLLAEGGFSFIYLAVDQNGQQYALKKQICQSKEAVERCVQEVKLLEQCAGVRGVVKLWAHIQIPVQGGCEIYALLDLVKGGNLLQYVRGRILPDSQILGLMIQAADVLVGLKQRGITHRDIKLENFLLDEEGGLVLCDFGSATSEQFDLGVMEGHQLTALEQFFQRNCTQMYRAPEMNDVRRRWQVGHAVDVWMLGCVMFELCFGEHPFANKGKLSIIEGDYSFRDKTRRPDFFKELVVSMLTPEPRQRLAIEAVQAALREGRLGEQSGWAQRKQESLRRDYEW